MNKEIIDLITDDRVPDELKMKMLLISFKMQACKTIGECKEVLLALVGLLTEVENLTDDKALRSH